MYIQVKESGRTEFSSGWQGCSLEFPFGFALGNPMDQPCQPSENPAYPSFFLILTQYVFLAYHYIIP